MVRLQLGGGHLVPLGASQLLKLLSSQQGAGWLLVKTLKQVFADYTRLKQVQVLVEENLR